MTYLKIQLDDVCQLEKPISASRCDIVMVESCFGTKQSSVKYVKVDKGKEEEEEE